ncbi:DUF2971 domain-containing protein [Shewanella frigidimarina]|uniref:DUF2971 domain-containing protein n=1 Tax=Shewanella frigidimarina TaxID=56812 RepID=UPI0031728D5A
MNKSIFRFYSNRDFDLDSLANSYLWFSKVEDFNDPFEGMYEERIAFPDVRNLSIDDAIDFYEKIGNLNTSVKSENNLPSDDSINHMLKTSKGRYELRRIVCEAIRESTLEQFNIAKYTLYHCCFVYNKDESFALKNKLMWSHYGAGLRGFAVEYLTDMNEGDILSKGKPVTVHGQEISYEKYAAKMIIKIMYDYMSGVDKVGIGKIINTKSPEWEYENEIRLSCEAQVVNYNKNIISSITIGEKMSMIKRNTLLAIINSLNLDISQLVKFACIDKKTLDIEIINFDDFMKV